MILETHTDKTIFQLIESVAQDNPGAIALDAPGRTPLSYNELHGFIKHSTDKLNQSGIGRGDVIAIALPNGPEMALAFLAAASAATAAPLNPAYRSSEYEFYLADLDTAAVLTLPGSSSPVIEAANKLKIPVILLSPDDNAPAGLFTLPDSRIREPVKTGLAQINDIALVLHTSGTTAQPKIVPLTHKNLCTSAKNISDTLCLTTNDRCLNVMPLFHIHGISACLLASLAAGARVICTPGFYAPKFFEWLSDFQPTWYSAVPTMHQAILVRAPEHKSLTQYRLRFVRSSSASLPPQVMAALEQTFNTSVIEAYGMTEAAHQMTSNPLPPQIRKPGSVGPAAGPEVAIMEENGGKLLPIDSLGEIVIRGLNVTSGYSNNPVANEESFNNGWFRTGDQGYKDLDGYFFITGRIKEIINRGGEKISPREVDEVLLGHPAVDQAVTFGMPDEHLGEDVAAAVILNDPIISERSLRRYVALQLSDFKVPKRIVFLDEIPKGPTGKLQRIGLAQKLGLGVDGTSERYEMEFVLPRSELEQAIADFWSEILKITEIGVHQRFLYLGGDSVLAAQLVSRIRDEFEIPITVMDFFDAPTIAEQAVLVEKMIIDQIEDLSDEEIIKRLDQSGNQSS